MTTHRTVLTETSRADASTVRLALSGNLDYDTADGVLRCVNGILTTQPGTRAVHLDCHAVRFCDTYGLSILIMTHRTVTAAGAHLQLENLPARLTRILEITGTLDLLTTAGDQREECDT
jgi:anti-anti-sigma factor